MQIIKFDLEELRKNLNGFSYYILGRSYDLEENGATEDFKEALKYYNEGMNLNYPLCEYSLGISLILGLGDVLEIDKEKGNKLLIDAYPKIIDLINFKSKVIAYKKQNPKENKSLLKGSCSISSLFILSPL